LFAEQQSPTSDTTPVEVEVGGLKLWIPANYMVFDSTRRGGHRREVELFAALPDLTGWSNWDSGKFDDNGPKSQIVFMPIREDHVNLTETERMQRIYNAYLADPKGAPGPFGLTQYAFRNDSGYHAEDLFVGQTGGGPVVLHCAKFGPDVPSPNCWRDMKLGRGASVSYRFKRSKLSHWREIADGVTRLMDSFGQPPK